MSMLPGHAWQDLKKELMEKWHELTENDLDSTRGNTHGIIDLLEKKVGMRIEDASERFAEIASHYHLYEEPEEEQATTIKPEEERLLELKPDRSNRPDIPSPPK